MALKSTHTSFKCRRRQLFRCILETSVCPFLYRATRGQGLPSLASSSAAVRASCKVTPAPITVTLSLSDWRTTWTHKNTRWQDVAKQEKLVSAPLCLNSGWCQKLMHHSVPSTEAGGKTSLSSAVPGLYWTPFVTFTERNETGKIGFPAKELLLSTPSQLG